MRLGLEIIGELRRNMWGIKRIERVKKNETRERKRERDNVGRIRIRILIKNNSIKAQSSLYTKYNGGISHIMT